MSEADLLLPHEAAERLGVAPSTVRRWDGKAYLVPAKVLPSGYRRYRPADVDELGRIMQLPPDARTAALAELRVRNLARAAELRAAEQGR